MAAISLLEGHFIETIALSFELKSTISRAYVPLALDTIATNFRVSQKYWASA